MEFTIRPATATDAPALAEIANHPDVAKNLMTMPTDSATDWAKRLERYKYSFVAVVDGEVVGMVGLAPGPLPRMAHTGLLHIMVHPRCHGQGIGTALMGFVVDFADQWLMLRRLELSVFSSNPGAQRLYERFGFTVEGRKRESAVALGRFVDEVLMARFHPNYQGLQASL